MDFIPLKDTAVKLASLAFKFATSVTFSTFLLFLVAVQAPFEASGRTFEKSDLSLEKAHQAVWEINNFKMNSKDLCVDKKYYAGTAFAISPNLFITNFHVLEGFRSRCADIEDLRLRQEGHSMKLKVRRIISVSATYDIALFEIEGSVEDHLNFAEDFSLERVNQQLSVVGYLKGSVNRVWQVKAISYEDALEYGVPVGQGGLSGMSGSPVFNKDGEVVGVLTSENETAYLFMLKLAHARTFIDGTLGVGCLDLRYLESCVLKGFFKAEKLAQTGNALAQFQIGREGRGHIVFDDSLLALAWLKQSAEAGFAPSQILLAGKYYFNDDANVRKDFGLAFHWSKKAADQNYISAQRTVGYMYYKGRGTEKNLKLAAYWLEKAAAQGDSWAQKFLREKIQK